MAWVNAASSRELLTGGLYALFAYGLSLMFGVMKVDEPRARRPREWSQSTSRSATSPSPIPGALVGFLIVVGGGAPATSCGDHPGRPGPRRAHHADGRIGLSVVIENGLRSSSRPTAARSGPGCLVSGSLPMRLADPDRLPARGGLRRGRDPCCSGCSTSCPAQVRSADPRGRRRPGGGATGRGGLPARVRHRGGGRVQHRGPGRHRLRHTSPSGRPRATTPSCCSRSRRW